MSPRPIEPEMQLLWERLDNMADVVGGLVRAIGRLESAAENAKGS